MYSIPGNPTRPEEGKIAGDNTPSQFGISAVYPNPFNSSAKIQFSLPSGGSATVVIYDLLGAKVATLIDRDIQQGDYSVTWNAKTDEGEDVPSGVYFCKLQSGDERATQKITLLR